jgi:hypothetical protein
MERMGVLTMPSGELEFGLARATARVLAFDVCPELGVGYRGLAEDVSSGEARPGCRSAEGLPGPPAFIADPFER